MGRRLVRLALRLADRTTRDVQCVCFHRGALVGVFRPNFSRLKSFGQPVPSEHAEVKAIRRVLHRCELSARRSREVTLVVLRFAHDADGVLGLTRSAPCFKCLVSLSQLLPGARLVYHDGEEMRTVRAADSYREQCEQDADARYLSMGFKNQFRHRREAHDVS